MNWLLFVFVLTIVIVFTTPTYRHPRVQINAISHEECDYIREKALPLLKDSTLGDTRHIDKSERKSESTFLDFERDPKLKEIILRFVKPEQVNRCENFQVVRYKPGGFYRPHQDADCKHENKRVSTIMFALNDDYEGGSTSFPVLGKTYKLSKGHALEFDTLDTRGRMNKKALHGGTPVISGEKWICTLWIRESKWRGR